MKVFYTKSFKGHYPVGGARFLCVAEDMSAAIAMLHKEMYYSGLKRQFQEAEEGLTELDTNEARVVDFGDGNY